MRKRTRIIFGIIWMFVACSFLFQSIDSVGAEDTEYPTKPINYIISYSAGGATDILVRALVKPVGKYLGQQFIVINKPGGGALLGSMEVMNALQWFSPLFLGLCSKIHSESLYSYPMEVF